MNPTYKGSVIMVVTVLLILFRSLSGPGQTNLLTESFENGGSIPAGWATEVISPNNQVTFVGSSTYPSGYTAYNGSWMTKFNSYDASGGILLLKRMTPVSAASYTNLAIDFYWLESTGYPSSNDKVDVEWSANGTTWVTAGTFPRYNPVQGWKFKTVSLPAGASNQPAIFIAFKFTSDYGNNCFLDFVHLSGVGPPPPVTVTIGTGTSSCSYPYNTGYMDARTQMLYTAGDIGNAGGAMGQIQQIGFNVITAGPTVMNGFTIKMRNTADATLTNWVTDSMTVCYSGNYTVAGTGWQMITLQTPFSYDGRNLLVEICYDNSSTGTGTTVYGTSAAGKIYHYYLNDPVGGGCTVTGSSPQIVRPNLMIVEQMYTGSLTGTVINCYNNQPIVGATVTVSGMPPVTTNASGVFTVLYIPCGTHTVTYTAAGFISQSCSVTIFANQMTVSPCGCLYPVPGYLAGVITNLATGAPIAGVKIQAGQTFTYSLADGSYLLAVYPCATLPVTYSKAGYNNISTLITFVCGSTFTQNLQMMPTMNPPENVVAVTDTVLGQTTLTWSPPQSPYDLIYDDGIMDQCFSWMNTGNINAVRFTPAAYPATVLGGRLFLCNPIPSGPPLGPFQVNLYDDDGPGGIPGTLISQWDVIPVSTGWVEFIFPDLDTITSGSFYLGMVQIGNYPNCDGLGLDTTTNSMRSWQKDVYNSGPWVPVQGNFMIRALVSGPGGTMPSSILSYKVSRLKHGEENNPAVWTTLGSVTGGTTTYVDNAWPSLPPGPYRWAVQTYYSTWTPSAPGFSNIQYKDWMADVTVYAEKCCPDVPGPISIRLSSMDTTYWATTDSTGHAYFQDVIYNTYTMTISLFGCSTYNLVLTITSNMSLNVQMTGGPAYPARDIYVNDRSLLSTWSPPMPVQSILEENWSSGSFTTNGWTVSGGTNWSVSTGMGNPAPSAMFNWSPQVVNYHQYLTSKVMNGIDAPETRLQYDIYLSGFASTNVNTMAIEFWDGTSWVVLKTYSNMNGSLPWTTEELSLPVTGNSSFRIRFHAAGEDSYDINNWNIDNIRIYAQDSLFCHIGYEFYLNSVLSTFVTDTFYQITPDQVQYGQQYSACVNAVYLYGWSVPVCYQFTSHYVYPPTNVTAQPLECTARLSWNKPEMAGGATPPGLIGYKIYREGLFHDSITSPDTLQYYDLALDPGHYTYCVTSVYDLTPYGFPGYTDESLCYENPGVNVICGDNLPFFENWNSGTFTYSGWTFEPEQGNWDVTSATGNPSPTADFSGFGLKSNGPYDYAMLSRALNASQWTCSDVWLDFDLELIDHAAGSTEHMTVEVLYNNSWHQVADFVNSGSFGFETKHILINEVRGQGTKIRFRAHGENTFNILHWHIDNINVYGVCMPPTGLAWSATTEQVELSWEAPCPEVSGYNIYRTDSSGLVPYYKINTDLVTATTFTDVPPFWTPNAVYRYFVTAVTMDSASSGVLCESGSTDTVLVEIPVAVPGLDPASVKIFPNPAKQLLTVKSSVPVVGMELVDHLGKPVLSKACDHSMLERVRTADIACGVYFLKIKTDRGIVVKKVIIQK